MSPSTPASWAAAEEILHAVLQHGVDVTHEHHGDADAVAEAFELLEQHGDRHPVRDGAGAAVLYHGAVRQGIGERHAQLHHVRAALLKRFHDGQRVVKGRESGGTIYIEDLLRFIAKKLIDAIHYLLL